jgi:CRISPR-associated protein Cmr3
MSKSLSTWIIEPRDPVIFRDGKPFDANAGARAQSLAFPFPSTVAGGVRTRAGRAEDGTFDCAKISELLQKEILGALLVELRTDDGAIVQYFAPAPADALAFDAGQDEWDLKRLVPLETPSDCHTNRPNNFMLVGPPRTDKRKPSDGAPKFWRWEQFQKWLGGAPDWRIDLATLGVEGLASNVRTHVKIDPDSQSAAESMLFQTRGLEFTHVPKGQEIQGARRRLQDARRLALAVATTARGIKEGVAPFGGERRLVVWSKSSQAFPECPKEVRESILKDKACRVILLTPAHFSEGWLPQWLTRELDGVGPKLHAVACNRYQTVSGWDFRCNKAKPTRRLAAAGSVYFLKFPDETSKEILEKWIEATWMRCVSDEEQDRRDGFGLAALGDWNGTPAQMEE